MLEQKGMKMAICYTCEENIPEESIIDGKCPECLCEVADRHGRVLIVEWERRQTDDEARRDRVAGTRLENDGRPL